MVSLFINDEDSIIRIFKKCLIIIFPFEDLHLVLFPFYRAAYDVFYRFEKGDFLFGPDLFLPDGIKTDKSDRFVLDIQGGNVQ